MASGTINRPPESFGFGICKIIGSDVDINALDANGIYSWGPSGKPSAAPFTRGVLINMRISSSNAGEQVQMAFSSSNGNGNKVYFRWRYSANPLWADWIPISKLPNDSLVSSGSLEAYALETATGDVQEWVTYTTAISDEPDNSNGMCNVIHFSSNAKMLVAYSRSGKIFKKYRYQSGTTWIWSAWAEIT